MTDAISQASHEEDNTLLVTIPEDTPPARLDKALALLCEGHSISRSRLRALIGEGRVTAQPEGTVCDDPSVKVRAGASFRIDIPPPLPAEPEPEDIPLTVVYEDAHLIVIDKPVGMVVHPAPGAWSGTLVNALLHHCGDSLSGIGGEKRPGIVHRIDKDTSGLLVVAKSDAAHHGLSEQFAAHTIERLYKALVWGAPSAADARMAGLPSVSFEPGWVRIETTIGRSRTDRKKMAANVSNGRHAITRFSVRERIGAASLVECRLETGRTHQIRVHLAHVGHPLVGDQTYGRARVPPRSLSEDARDAIAAFPRQALHAATLGFEHPVTGETMRWSSPIPGDIEGLRANFTAI
jgi:23S rRNA pseudouridine1911/1915/1917 synthase